MIKKNQAATITFYESAKSGSLTSPVVTLSKDGATATTITSEVTIASLGNGVFSLTLTATHTNADVLTIRITATGIEPIVIIINTDPNDYATQTTVNAIKAVTDDIPDNLLTTTSSVSLSSSTIASIRSGLATEATVSGTSSTIASIYAKVQNLPTSPAATSDIPTVSQIVSGILTSNLNSITTSVPEYSLYTMIQGSLKSTVTITSADAGTWIIYKPDGTTHVTIPIEVDENAKPITKIN